jgi:DNA-directed RNA polymerase subunit RPC12/RpoP
MATTTLETFQCMMCGHQYQEPVQQGEDKERACPKCRSNSIRHLRKTAASADQPLTGRRSVKGQPAESSRE